MRPSQRWTLNQRPPPVSLPHQVTWKEMMKIATWPGLQEKKDHNTKLAQKKEGHRIEVDNQRHRFENNSLGHIPDGLGVISIDSVHEHLNAFRGILSQHFYYAEDCNTIYTGWMAVEASRLERNGRRTYKIAPN